MQELIDTLMGARAVATPAQRDDHENRVRHFVPIMRLPMQLSDTEQYFKDQCLQYAYPQQSEGGDGSSICFYGALACLARHHLQATDYRQLQALLSRVRDSILGPVPTNLGRSPVPDRLRQMIEVLQIT